MKNMFNFPSTTIRKIKISHQLNFQKFEKHTQLAQWWGNRLSCVAVKYCIWRVIWWRDEDFLLCDSVSWIQQSYKYTYIYKPAISKISQLGILWVALENHQSSPLHIVVYDGCVQPQGATFPWAIQTRAVRCIALLLILALTKWYLPTKLLFWFELSFFLPSSILSLFFPSPSPSPYFFFLN